MCVCVCVTAASTRLVFSRLLGKYPKKNGHYTRKNNRHISEAGMMNKNGYKRGKKNRSALNALPPKKTCKVNTNEKYDKKIKKYKEKKIFILVWLLTFLLPIVCVCVYLLTRPHNTPHPPCVLGAGIILPFSLYICGRPPIVVHEYRTTCL